MCLSNVLGVVQGIWETKKAIFKNDYTLEQEPYGAAGDFAAPDGHEFSMVDDGRAYLQPIFKKVVTDLTPYGAEEDGQILDACFQEISVETGHENFHWCYMDHYPIHNTYIYMNITGNTVNITSHMAGFGNEERPWDAFHPNAMDKNFEGDYLFSIRHTDEIIKIAGRQNMEGFQPGHVIWKMGGKLSDVELSGFNFSRQHHARFIETTPSSTTLSFFDNAYEGDKKPSSRYSTGKVVRIEHATMQATLQQELKHPEELLSMAAGSMQSIPNGHHIIGWGWRPYVTEYDANGKVIYDANFAQTEGGFSYRTRKYPWVGKPHWKPKILVYSETCSPEQSPLMTYVSWNGATEVRHWKYHVSLTDALGPWYDAGTFPKLGFETATKLMTGKYLKHSPFVRWVSVQALDADRNVLGETMSKTFVPNEKWREHTCNEEGCAHDYEYPPKSSVAEQCSTTAFAYLIPGFFALIVIFFALETLDTVFNRLLDGWSGKVVTEGYIMTEKYDT